MKKVVFYLGALATAVSILAYFGISPANDSASKNIGIKGNQNSGNIVIQDGENINIGTKSEQVPPAFQCPDELSYIAKAGQYGAINVEVYRELEKKLAAGSSQGIEKLLLDGQIHRFKGGEVVCLKSTASYNYRKKVFVPSRQLSYWVKDDVIVKVD